MKVKVKRSSMFSVDDLNHDLKVTLGSFVGKPNTDAVVSQMKNSVLRVLINYGLATGNDDPDKLFNLNFGDEGFDINITDLNIIDIIKSESDKLYKDLIKI